MRRLAVTSFVLLAFGCTSVEPEERLNSSNNTVTVERVTTFDGCILYRVRADRDIYIARCGNVPTFADSTYQTTCGKGCVKTVVVEAYTSPLGEADVERKQ